jgi:hypothetical protein
MIASLFSSRGFFYALFFRAKASRDMESVNEELKPSKKPAKMSQLQLTLESGTLVRRHEILEVRLTLLSEPSQSNERGESMSPLAMVEKQTRG